MLPEGWAECESHWHYGWPVTGNMLYNMLTTHFGLTKDSLDDADLFLGASLARTYLRHRSGCLDLRMLYCKADEQAETAGQVFLRNDKKLVQVLTMTCTASKRLLKRWATKEQYEYLMPMLGEPRWFEDCFTKKEFKF